MEKMEIDLQKMKGDIDALRVGVMTGQMPGTDPDQEGSIAKTLNELGARLEKVEEDQLAVRVDLPEGMSAEFVSPLGSIREINSGKNEFQT